MFRLETAVWCIAFLSMLARADEGGPPVLANKPERFRLLSAGNRWRGSLLERVFREQDTRRRFHLQPLSDLAVV